MNKNQLMENEQMLLENYWGSVCPLGDWRNPVVDTPLMTQFVQTIYNTRSNNTKRDYYFDIIDSFSSPAKKDKMLTDRFKQIPNIKELEILVNDTINIHADNTLSFCNENLRREFVQAEYGVTRTPVNGPAVCELDLANSGITADGLVGILTNIKSIEMYSEVMNGINKSVVPHVATMFSILNQANPQLGIAFRKLLAAAEGTGVLTSILRGLHEGATAVKPVINVTGDGPIEGLTVADMGQDAEQKSTLADMISNVNIISGIAGKFAAATSGKLTPEMCTQRIKDILMSSADDTDIDDLKVILQNSVMSIKNYEKYAMVISTLMVLPKVIGPNAMSAIMSNDQNRASLVALLYISKLLADKQTNGNAGVKDILTGLSVIEEIDLSAPITNQADAQYHMSLADAIYFDMTDKNPHATEAFGKLMKSNEVIRFAKHMLSRIQTPIPYLTKVDLIKQVQSTSPMKRDISHVDVDEFLKMRQFISGPNTPPAYRQEIIDSVIQACKR